MKQKFQLLSVVLACAAIVYGVTLGMDHLQEGTRHASAAACSDFNGDEVACTEAGCDWATFDVDCTILDEGNCLADPGCTPLYIQCGDLMDEGSCPSEFCFWDGETCTGTEYFDFCDGGYAVSECQGTPFECGNGILEGAEACDDGNFDAGDGCSSCGIDEGWDCYGEPTVCSQCGDGVLNDDFAGMPGEQCDDGNNDPNDGCGTSAACYVDDGWTCDTGSPTVCTEDPVCGDGDMQAGEECDDSNTNNDDGCDEFCVIEFCGDGTENWNEDVMAVDECDDGGTEPNDGCNAYCQFEYCGDNLINDNVEECDDGNADPGDGCSESCAIEGGWHCEGEPSVCQEDAPECGNLECEEGEDGDSCYTDCGMCGDGSFEETDGEEQCDDGDTDSGDGCSDSCQIEEGWECPDVIDPTVCYAVCGDGVILGEEQCDDANIANDDGCSDTCQFESGWHCDGEPSACAPDAFCGNMECDDGEDGDNCYEDCGACGNGMTEGPEGCDDGNFDNGDGCADDCTIEDGWDCPDADPTVCTLLCGNGVVDAGEECDDGSMLDVVDGCTMTCEIDEGWYCEGDPSTCSEIVCGDGLIRGEEICDDGNTNDGDGCSSVCTEEGEWNCTEEPSVCTLDPVCGDGDREGPDEQCDDGNAVNGDGCDSACAVEDGFMIAHWTFDEGAGTSVADVTGNGFDASFGGDPVWSDGNPGIGSDDGSLVFSNDKVQFDPVSLGTSYTVAAWVKLSALGGRYTVLSNSDSSFNMPLLFITDAENKLYSSTEDGQFSVSYSSWNLNWHHVVVARSGNQMHFFVDGVQIGGTVNSGFSAATVDQIGTYSGGLQWFSGAMADVRIYGSRLSDDAIADLAAGVECRDGTIDAGEQCDDGNATNDDACSNRCTLNGGDSSSSTPTAEEAQGAGGGRGGGSMTSGQSSSSGRQSGGVLSDQERDNPPSPGTDLRDTARQRRTERERNVTAVPVNRDTLKRVLKGVETRLVERLREAEGGSHGAAPVMGRADQRRLERLQERHQKALSGVSH